MEDGTSTSWCVCDFSSFFFGFVVGKCTMREKDRWGRKETLSSAFPLKSYTAHQVFIENSDFAGRNRDDLIIPLQLKYSKSVFVVWRARIDNRSS